MRFYTVSSIARIVGIPLTTAQRRMEKYGMAACDHVVAVSGTEEHLQGVFSEERLHEIAPVLRNDPEQFRNHFLTPTHKHP